MRKKGSGSLGKVFSTARDKVLHAARKNFEYVYQNGGYSPENLVDIFHQTMPVIKWDRTVVYKFLHPKDGQNITLHSAGIKDIARFVEKSIELRDQVQNELKKAEKMINDAQARWGDLLDNPPQRQIILDHIRGNFRYVHENGGFTFEQLAVLFKEAHPDHSWDKSAVRRFLYPEKMNDEKKAVHVTHASPKMLSDLLKASIDERTRVINSARPLTDAPHPSID